MYPLNVDTLSPEIGPVLHMFVVESRCSDHCPDKVGATASSVSVGKMPNLEKSAAFTVYPSTNDFSQTHILPSKFHIHDLICLS